MNFNQFDPLKKHEKAVHDAHMRNRSIATACAWLVADHYRRLFCAPYTLQELKNLGLLR